MLVHIQFILLQVLAPVLAMVGLGALVHRYRALDVTTLVRLNLYLFVPVFLFTRIAESELSWGEIGGIGGAVLAPMALLGVPIYLGLRAARAGGNTIAAVVVGGLFYNAGNFGIPIAELAFGRAGGAVQSLVLLFANTMIFFVGYVIIALAQGRSALAGLGGYFKLPMVYTIAAGFLVRETGVGPPQWLDKALHIIADGMVPVALVTLGAQLASRAAWPRWKLIGPVMAVKLAAMPAMTALVVYAFGLWPWPGAQLILAASAPTAVNTLLVVLELDGDAETAADCVFWTTIVSALTITLTLALITMSGGGPPG